MSFTKIHAVVALALALGPGCGQKAVPETIEPAKAPAETAATQATMDLPAGGTSGEQGDGPGPASAPEPDRGLSTIVLAQEAEPGKVTFGHEAHQAGQGCSACHHTTTGGSTPKSCHACHGTDADTLDAKDAFHKACKGCHAKMGGPSKCSGCHRK